ncbi:MAG: hypothetical protein JWL81_2620 [Verrucomicrobiales bacterium]|nr:hypothetical protein [Verrucomicrobiales bacterium]
MKRELLHRLSDWIRGIGLTVREQSLNGTTFLPGLTIGNGELVVDPDKILWPGDLLHEAGHLALTPAADRPALNGKLTVTPAEEMAAMAWSYAAALDAGVGAEVVFHEGGYRNGGSQLAAQYASGLPPGGPGVPILQWYGMTTAFPRMTHWLRPEPSASATADEAAA